VASTNKNLLMWDFDSETFVNNMQNNRTRWTKIDAHEKKKNKFLFYYE